MKRWYLYVAAALIGVCLLAFAMKRSVEVESSRADRDAMAAGYETFVIHYCQECRTLQRMNPDNPHLTN